MGAYTAGLPSADRKSLGSAKRLDRILQCLDAGIPQGRGGGIDAAELRGQRRDALAMAVAEPRRPRERHGRRRLDEDALCCGTIADADRGGHRIGRRGDRRHRVVRYYVATATKSIFGGAPLIAI